MLLCGRCRGRAAFLSSHSRRGGGERGRRARMPPATPPSRARGRQGFRNRLPGLAPPRTAGAGRARSLRRAEQQPPPVPGSAAAQSPRGEGEAKARCEVQVLWSLFSSFHHGRSVNVSYYSFKLLVQD
ncbi:E3 ubiquitin-protein ligase RNF152 isoform 2-T9 [Ara ararauna]